MTLQQLRDFIALADSGSLRAAARQRGVTGPALAKSLGVLEEELHVRLLERRARGTALTEYGAALLSHARLIDAQSRQAVEDIAQRRGKQEGAITIGMGPSPGVVLVPEVLNDFRRKFPVARVAVVGGQYYDHIGPLRLGQMDLAVAALPKGTQEAGIATEHLFYSEVVVACRHGHPLSRSRNLADLVDCVWALTGPIGRGPGSSILGAFQEHGLPLPTRLVQCDMTWTLYNLIAHSDTLCALPRLLVEQPFLNGALHSMPIAGTLPCHSIGLILRADAPLLPMADYMATLIRRHAHYFSS